MISMYKWQQIKVLRAEGTGIKGIARKLAISKNTVKKYLRCLDPPQFKTREYERMLDGYGDKIKEMLMAKYIGTRIFAELEAMGYKGSLSGIHRYIRKVRMKEEISEKITTRVETPPGIQMQYDWKEWMLPVSELPLKIYLHEVVLSYSRLKHYSLSLSITDKDVIRAIEAAILFFGGTARELIIDNPKQMVLTHRQHGVTSYNETFLKFCGLYGIEPNACRPYRARTKGKAERPFYFLQEHLLRGLSVTSLEEFECKLMDFTQAYNERLHSTLGESPHIRFQNEKRYLRPILKVEPTLLYEREIRRVSFDGYLSYRGGFYPVPMRLCGQEVWLETVLGRFLRVYDKKGIIVSEQPVHLFEQKMRPVHPEHEAINQGYTQKKEALRSALVSRFISLFGEIGQAYLAGLRSNVGANVYWHLSEILTVSDLYEQKEVAQVLEICIEMGSYHKNTALRLLGTRPHTAAVLLPIPTLDQWPKAKITRPLSAYADVEEVAHE